MVQVFNVATLLVTIVDVLIALVLLGSVVQRQNAKPPITQDAVRFQAPVALLGTYAKMAGS